MNNVSLPVNRIYKDRLYKMIFNDKSELLKLYNALPELIMMILQC